MNETAALAQVGMLLIRPGMVIALAPGLGGTFVPAQVKVALTLLVAVVFLPSVAVSMPGTAVGLVGVVAREVAIGLALGSAVRALVAGVELAGHLSGFQVGYSYAATIDPSSGARHNAVTALFGMLAILTLLSVDGHHMVLRALASSYQALPIGPGAVDGSLPDRVRDLFALVFTVGARLAAPIVIVMLVVEVVVGLVSRSAPSLGFMVVGYPVRLTLGLFVLGLIVGAVPRAVADLAGTATAMGLQIANAFK